MPLGADDSEGTFGVSVSVLLVFIYSEVFRVGVSVCLCVNSALSLKEACRGFGDPAMDRTWMAGVVD